MLSYLTSYEFESINPYFNMGAVKDVRNTKGDTLKPYSSEGLRDAVDLLAWPADNRVRW